MRNTLMKESVEHSELSMSHAPNTGTVRYEVGKMVKTVCPECGELMHPNQKHECEDLVEDSKDETPDTPVDTGPKLLGAVEETLTEIGEVVQNEVVEDSGVSCESESENDLDSSSCSDESRSGSLDLSPNGGIDRSSHVRTESETKREAAVRLMDTQPELSNREIAEIVGSSRSYIENVRSEDR